MKMCKQEEVESKESKSVVRKVVRCEVGQRQEDSLKVGPSLSSCRSRSETVLTK